MHASVSISPLSLSNATKVHISELSSRDCGIAAADSALLLDMVAPDVVRTHPMGTVHARRDDSCGVALVVGAIEGQHGARQGNAE
jgi:hypothetical protein